MLFEAKIKIGPKLYESSFNIPKKKYNGLVLTKRYLLKTLPLLLRSKSVLSTLFKHLERESILKSVLINFFTTSSRLFMLSQFLAKKLAPLMPSSNGTAGF
jgi:hypothetical protein